jgi:soluble lytic murein transglycosylase-like protein
MPVARALVACATLLTGAAWTNGQAEAHATGPLEPQETAMAIPRVRAPGGGPVGLPQPLRPSEAARIRRIYALLAADRLDEAAARTAALGPSLLRGDLIAARYLRAPPRVATPALAAWLRRWPELPAAPAIRAVLDARTGVLPVPPAPPAAANPSPPTADAPPPLRLPPLIAREVSDRVDAGAFDTALRLIASARGLDPLAAATLRTEVAHGLFRAGHPLRALTVAQGVLAGPGAAIGEAGYVGGLAAWQLSRSSAAGRLFAQAMFAQAWRARYLAPDRRSAVAFWAARSAASEAEARRWLRRAATASGAFYALLARQRLLETLGLDRAMLGEADAEAVDATPEGQRAFAFLQVGQDAAAAAELLRLWPRAGGDPALRRAILLVAHAAALPDLAATLASDWVQHIAPASEPPPSPPPLEPNGGFVLSPALVYAVARVESGFDAGATSSQGARGMMQLMPSTAAYVGGPGAASRIGNTGENLAIGQRYMLYLSRAVDHDLLRMLASYNAGPGGAAKWMGTIDDGGDPLLFIELIPIDETRHYVRDALAFAWAYAAHLHVASPGLAALAAGRWPRLDGGFQVPLH